MIVVNFKGYSEAMGEKAEELAEICARVSDETGREIVVCPQPQDIRRVSEKGVETFAQHVSRKDTGSHTGHVLAEGVKRAGATGTMIDHSERRLEPEIIEKTVEKSKETGLGTILCAKTPDEVDRYSSFKPDYISIEPPELIGGETAVSTAKPEMIRKAVEKTADGVETLAGAGIKDAEDVEKSIELGCSGILVASGVVKSDDPEESLRRLCKGL
jgi:triosephosphate isomerase